MGQDHLQYSQVTFSVFSANFVPVESSYEPIKVLNAANNDGSAGRLGAKSDIPAVLCHALNAVIGDSERRFKVVPKATEAKAPAPAVALFTNPKSVSALSAWAWMAAPVDVVVDETAAGFHFALPSSSEKKSVPFLVDTPAGKDARAQLEEYALEILAHQHRVHIFMLHISKNAARVSRWDRAGCIVSEPVDLSTAKFDNFVARLAQLSPLEQGYDDEATLATQEQIELLREYYPANRWLRHYRDLILNNLEEFPLYQISCPAIIVSPFEQMARATLDQLGMPSFPDDDSDDDDDGPMQWNIPYETETRTFLVGRPTTNRRTLVGKCTTGFVAFDPLDCRMVFLKDQWRDGNQMYSELDVYRQLAWRVPDGVAQLVAGGEVAHHRTRSQQFTDSWKSPSRVHIRLVSQQVGRPIESAESGRKLLFYITCALDAHSDAWLKARILHHDISDGNILIDVEKEYGFLNDWDISKHSTDIKWKAERSDFYGTWAFGSALALQYPRKPIEVEDDIEAFIWLIVYIVLERMDHGLSTEDRDALVDKLFYVHKHDESGRAIGGELKLEYIKRGEPPVQLKDAQDPVAVFLADAFKLLRDVYAKVDYTAIEHWRTGKREKGSFVPHRRSKSVLDGLTHRAVYDLLAKACNNWEDEREQKQKSWDDAIRAMQAMVNMHIGERDDSDMPPMGYD
ncbi:hypothetical protein PsYK624_135380 [Phanerochaete sordida]|uniref:Fungal-type protein kinase domain-containing protein n=1 Tax=Phanerochaete sordida TaxID=48140 RepID=A0A9P3GL53_9APHY|nr:hypothetical protein PsYK624_135380 [Phanerochaete sordida]